MGLVWCLSVTDDGLDALPNQEAPLWNRGTRQPVVLAAASGKTLDVVLDRVLDGNKLERNNLVRRLEGQQQIEDAIAEVRRQA